MKIKNLNFKVPSIEFDRLDDHAKHTGRTRTDIIREFIRSLPTYKEG